MNGMDLDKVKKLICDMRLDPDVAQAVGALLDEAEKLQKAFVLASRTMYDHFDCPFAFFPINWRECGKKICGHKGPECWQRYFRERVQREPVCRVCGCTQENACLGGCSWVEPDLCSACAELVK